jgi:hypothetical protein
MTPSRLTACAEFVEDCANTVDDPGKVGDKGFAARLGDSLTCPMVWLPVLV